MSSPFSLTDNVKNLEDVAALDQDSLFCVDFGSRMVCNVERSLLSRRMRVVFILMPKPIHTIERVTVVAAEQGLMGHTMTQLDCVAQECRANNALFFCGLSRERREPFGSLY